MKLLTYGVAGIATACLIFGVALIPPSELAKFFSTSGYPSTSISPNAEVGHVAVKLSVSEITQPRGVGSRISLDINVTAKIDLPEVVLRIDLSKAGQEWNSSGIELENATTSLKLDLAANISTSLTLTISAKEVGYGAIRVAALEPGSGIRVYVVGEQGPTDSLGILVQQDEILVFEDWHGVLPPIWPSDFNPNLPITPGQIGNFTLPWPPQ